MGFLFRCLDFSEIMIAAVSQPNVSVSGCILLGPASLCLLRNQRTVCTGSNSFLLEDQLNAHDAYLVFRLI